MDWGGFANLWHIYDPSSGYLGSASTNSFFPNHPRSLASGRVFCTKESVQLFKSVGSKLEINKLDCVNQCNIVISAIQKGIF